MVHKEYSKKITACIAILVILSMIAAFAVFESRREPKPAWDTEFPIANAQVSWDQTFYGGPEVKP